MWGRGTVQRRWVALQLHVPGLWRPACGGEVPKEKASDGFAATNARLPRIDDGVQRAKYVIAECEGSAMHEDLWQPKKTLQI